MQINLSTIWHMLREDYKVHLFKIVGADVDATGKKITSVIEINSMCCHWDVMLESHKAAIHKYFETIAEE